MEHRGSGPFTVAPICQNPPHAVVNMAAVRKLRLHGPAQAWRQIPAFRDEGPILQQGCWELTFSQGPRLGKVRAERSEEHTSELQSLMRISYAVFCLKKKNKIKQNKHKKN